MRYYCAYLLRVVRTSSLRCSTIFALLACFAPCLLRFPFLSISSVPHNFRACFSFSIITAYLSLSLSFVTTGSVTWAAWISASAFCPSCVPRRKRRRNEGKNRIQICRRSSSPLREAKEEEEEERRRLLRVRREQEQQEQQQQPSHFVQYASPKTLQPSVFPRLKSSSFEEDKKRKRRRTNTFKNQS